MNWTGPPLLDARLVVVAPHPDDEILAAGGLMRWTAHHQREVVVVAVTDGEASHASSDRVGAAELREWRARERTEALARLGVPEVTLHRLGAPDQGCADHVHEIAAAIDGILERDDVVVGAVAARPAPRPRRRRPRHAVCRCPHRVDALVRADLGARPRHR